MRRQVAKEPALALRNRFFERNPSLAPEGSASIARPTLKKWQEAGDGPLFKVFSEPGAFLGDAFAVSGGSLYRIAALDGTATLKGSLGTITTMDMAATAAIGEGVPGRLFIATGQALMYY